MSNIALILMLDALRLEIRAASYEAVGATKGSLDSYEKAAQTRRIATEKADISLNDERYRESRR